jgi:hypothetical protein
MALALRDAALLDRPSKASPSYPWHDGERFMCSMCRWRHDVALSDVALFQPVSESSSCYFWRDGEPALCLASQRAQVSSDCSTDLARNHRHVCGMVGVRLSKVIHVGPCAGGGMTVALSDVALLSDMLHQLPDFGDPVETANRTAAFYTRRKPLSATINTLANALYQVGRSL